MPEKFLIRGGKPLKGVVEVMGAKNVTFPLLAATLLTKEPCQVSNLPLIEDVFKMLKILERMGAKIKWLGERQIEIKCSDVDPSLIPYDVISFFRGSILFLGPLLARFGKIKFPPPGGCVIGARPIDTHLDAFSQSGVKISIKNNFYYFEGKLKPQEVILNEFSVTATENILLSSSLVSGETTIKIADQDYQVQELIKVLKRMGVKIKGLGTHTLKIIGQKRLKGFKYSVIPDPLEAGTFIVATLATKGEVLIKNAELQFLELFLKRLKDFGAKFDILGAKLIKV